MKEELLSNLPHPASEDADKSPYEEVDMFESMTDLYQLPEEKFEFGYHNTDKIRQQADESVEEYIARYSKVVVTHAQRDLHLYPNDKLIINGQKKTYSELLFSGAFQGELESLLSYLSKLDNFDQAQSLRSIRNSKSMVFGEAGYAADYPSIDKIDEIFSSSTKSHGISTDRHLLHEVYHDSPQVDTRSYANVLFSIPDIQNSLTHTYLKNRIDNKDVLVLGGGDSLMDMLTQEDINPASVTNVDPFLSKEEVFKNKKSTYRSVCIEAEDPRLISELSNKEVVQYNEVWSLYSVPFYTKDGEGMKSLVKNVSELLAPGGTWRIYPYGFPVFGQESPEGSDERINAFQNAVIQLLDGGDFDVRIVKHREELGYRTMVITKKKEILKTVPDREL